MPSYSPPRRSISGFRIGASRTKIAATFAPHRGSEVLRQVEDLLTALAAAEELEQRVELAAQPGDLLIALCQQCSDAVGDAVDEFLFGKWVDVGLRGRRSSVVR